jgi:hypothetical protein
MNYVMAVSAYCLDAPSPAPVGRLSQVKLRGWLHATMALD